MFKNTQIKSNKTYMTYVKGPFEQVIKKKCFSRLFNLAMKKRV